MKVAICDESNCAVAVFKVREDAAWCPNCGTEPGNQVKSVTVKT